MTETLPPNAFLAKSRERARGERIEESQTRALFSERADSDQSAYNEYCCEPYCFCKFFWCSGLVVPCLWLLDMRLTRQEDETIKTRRMFSNLNQSMEAQSRDMQYRIANFQRELENLSRQAGGRDATQSSTLHRRTRVCPNSKRNFNFMMWQATNSNYVHRRTIPLSCKELPVIKTKSTSSNQRFSKFELFSKSIKKSLIR